MPYSEVSRFLEINPELLTQFAQVFIARWDTYPCQLPDGAYTRAWSILADDSKAIPPLTLAHLERHLTGQQTIGACLLDARSMTSRIVLDDDSEQGLDHLRELAQDFQHQGIPAYLERSSRGGHLWIHTPLLSGVDARRIGIHLLQTHNLTTNDIELYPKQDALQAGHVGSLVRLPFGKHLKTGRFYGFVDLDGHDLAERRRDQLTILAHPERISQQIIDGLLRAAPEIKKTFQIHSSGIRHYRDDLPPAVQIKQAISPYDFISQYVDLDPTGKGLCPFHDDHRYSFKVYADGWHCFAGCEGHTIIDFYIQWQGYPSLKLASENWKAVLADMLNLLGL